MLVLIGREPPEVAGPRPGRCTSPWRHWTRARPTACCGPTSVAASWPIRFAPRCSSRAQGNPYFLAELLHLLVDRGLLLRDGDGWVASGPLPDAALPAAVQSVLAARIDGLDPEAKSVLRAASVLGIRFAAQALPVVDQRPEAEVHVGAGGADQPPAGAAPQEGRALVDLHPSDGPRRRLRQPARRPTEPVATPGRRCGPPSAAPARPQVDTFVGAQAEQALAARRVDGSGRRRLGAPGPLRRLRGAGTTRADGPAPAMNTATPPNCWPGRRGSERTTSPRELVISRRMTSATALASLRRLDEADAELAPALDGATGELRLAVLVVLGELRQKQGRDAEAVETLTTALAEARAAGSQRWMSAAVRQLGLVDYYAGTASARGRAVRPRPRAGPARRRRPRAPPGRWSTWPGRRPPAAITQRLTARWPTPQSSSGSSTTPAGWPGARAPRLWYACCRAGSPTAGRRRGR